MAQKAPTSIELSNSIIYDTIAAGQHYYGGPSEKGFLFETKNTADGIHNNQQFDGLRPLHLRRTSDPNFAVLEPIDERPNLGTQGRQKRKRRSRVCKNKEDAETQRMTHITIERNRRKQMNEHLAVLRSMMPESYITRGDQASIVGGAIEFVKELEQLLQSLEAHKRLQQQGGGGPHGDINTALRPPFAQFFSYPQYFWCQAPREHPVKKSTAIADIEVTLIETHTNLRILTQRRPRQLFKMVAGFQSLCLTILHLNLTTLDPLVLYSFNAKLEEGCHLSSVDDIAGAVHHMLGIIDDEAALT